MRNASMIGLLLASSLLLNGCGPQSPPSASSEGQSAPAAGGSIAAAAPVMLFNAYTAKELDANHNAGTPTRDFTPSDKVYVGVVLHGEASAASVRIDWSLVNGPVLGSVESTVPVAKTTTAALDLTKVGQFKTGKYRVLVYLDGKPNWELRFSVD